MSNSHKCSMFHPNIIVRCRSSVHAVSFRTEYIPKHGPTDVMDKLILKLDNSLFYMNVENIRKDIDKLIENDMRCLSLQGTNDQEMILPPRESYVYIDISKVNFIDFMGASCLFEIAKEYKTKGIFVMYTNGSASVMEILKRHSSFDEKIFNECEFEEE